MAEQIRKPKPTAAFEYGHCIIYPRCERREAGVSEPNNNDRFLASVADLEGRRLPDEIFDFNHQRPPFNARRAARPLRAAVGAGSRCSGS